MGIFTRKNRVPQPQITVHLDDASGTFHPGSPVRGTASILSSVPRQLLISRICLIGRITTHSTRRDTTTTSGVASGANTSTVYIRYYDEAQLFNINQELSSNISLEPDHRVVYPFFFTFPAQTGEIDASPYTRGTTHTGVYASETHALPPSFSHVKSPDDYATIDYRWVPEILSDVSKLIHARLQVVAHFGEQAEPFIYNESQPLVFCPFQSRNYMGTVEFVKPPQAYASSRLLGEEKSIGHSLRDKFSSKTPSVNVVLKASVPASVSMASGFMLHTCIEMDRLSHPSINVPNAVIGIKSLKLVPITAWRALKVKRSGHVFGGDPPEHEVVDEETVRLNAIPGTATVEQRRVEKGDILAFPAAFEARVPGNVCPTFKTLNINRSYFLKVTLEAEVSGKAFEYKFETRIWVLSNLYA